MATSLGLTTSPYFSLKHWIKRLSGDSAPKLISPLVLTGMALARDSVASRSSFLRRISSSSCPGIASLLLLLTHEHSKSLSIGVWQLLSMRKPTCLVEVVASCSCIFTSLSPSFPESSSRTQPCKGLLLCWWLDNQARINQNSLFIAFTKSIYYSVAQSNQKLDKNSNCLKGISVDTLVKITKNVSIFFKYLNFAAKTGIAHCQMRPLWGIFLHCGMDQASSLSILPIHYSAKQSKHWWSSNCCSCGNVSWLLTAEADVGLS